ncbi:MAG TPA: BON domain-containing protein [Kofleriaceae bacterium]
MANHNQSGGRGSFAEDRASWRPRDPSSQATRGHDAEADRGDDHSWRDRGVRGDERPTGECEPRRWETGRGEPSPGSFEERYRDDRYWQDRTGYDVDRYAGQGGRDFEAERRGLMRAGYGHGHGERMGYAAGSYSRGSTGYTGSAVQDMPPRDAGPEPHVHRGTGPHRGKGPSGYQRSDERIRELVCESLADDDQIDATHIEVVVNHGEVTLSGIVEDRRAKRDAEDCAWSISGVRDVQSTLRVDDRSIRSAPTEQSTEQSTEQPIWRNAARKDRG